MRVLGISLFATIACALFSGATPTNLKTRDAVHVSARAGTLSGILTTATDKLTAVKIGMGATDSTVDAVVPIIEDVESILNDAIGAVEVLAGSLVGEVIADVAQLVAGVVTLVAQILFAVTKLVGKGAIASLLTDVGSLLCTLLGLIFKLIPGLLALVIPLLGSVIQILINLNLLQVLSVLGITV
ncbi:hypothetical protein M378DRAFT_180695 [Amanita muscaria Koide BX008]|uniref:Uncharacterized protein n=1 Tax=Amanita muscaria (strain Koide BX008) TaxID=946122 RepID=A0A0C2SA99_AMAMK|nr:hypothetical protein M378DRAFT_180695 [Amanita muscaria Koide BX008]